MASYPTFNLNNPRDLSGVYTQEELSTMTDIEMTNAMYACGVIIVFLLYMSGFNFQAIYGSRGT